MFLYGFELEAFFLKQNGTDGIGEVILPPKDWPADGYPGLLEFRSTGGLPLDDAFACLEKDYTKYYNQCPSGHEISTDQFRHKFTPEQQAAMRKEGRFFGKNQVDVKSLYGKKARDNKGYTFASFQINISNQIRAARTVESFNGDKKTVHPIPAAYGLLDIPNIVWNLDNEFKDEIAVAKRQLGVYAIKSGETRLEYRSLPNFVVSFDFVEKQKLLSRIRKCVEE